MPTYLQATAALEATRKMYERARSAAAAAPGDKAKEKAARDLAASLTAAYATAIEAAAGEPSLAAKRDALIEAKVIHHEKYEKKTVETEDKPADPPESEEPEEAAPETAPSEEEEPSSSAGAAAPSKAPKMGKRAESEEEEEKAIAAGYARAGGSYQRAMAGAGVDAYGAVYGPKALLAACQKALGTSSIRETFGALRQLPEKLKASSELAARVEGLEKSDRKSRVNALVEKAKIEGRTRGKEHRAELRALGMRLGTAELRGVIKMLTPIGRPALEPKEDGATGREKFQGDDAEERAIKQACEAIPAAQRAEFEAMYRANLKASLAPKIPAA